MISSSDRTAVSGSTFQGEALMRRRAHERRVRCGDGCNGVEPALPLCAQTVEWTCLDGMHACALPRVGTRLSNMVLSTHNLCAPNPRTRLARTRQPGHCLQWLCARGRRVCGIQLLRRHERQHLAAKRGIRAIGRNRHKRVRRRPDRVGRWRAGRQLHIRGGRVRCRWRIVRGRGLLRGSEEKHSSSCAAHYPKSPPPSIQDNVFCAENLSKHIV